MRLVRHSGFGVDRSAEAQIPEHGTVNVFPTKFDQGSTVVLEHEAAAKAVKVFELFAGRFDFLPDRFVGVISTGQEVRVSRGLVELLDLKEDFRIENLQTIIRPLRFAVLCRLKTKVGQF